MQIRREVQFFAEWMERALRSKDAKWANKSNWYLDSDGVLLCRTYEELDELKVALRRHEKEPAFIFDACADVANFMMMIADNHLRKEKTKRDEEQIKMNKGMSKVASYREQVQKRIDDIAKKHSELLERLNICEEGIKSYGRVLDLLSNYDDDYDGNILDLIKELYPVD